MKHFFILYFLFFILFCFAIPIYRIWKDQKFIPVTFKKTDSAHDYIGMIFKVIIFFSAVPAFLLFAGGQYFSFIVPFPLPYASFYIGLILMIASIIWIMLAQMQMEKSWRIGIDYERKTDLVIKGFFNYSRNPIYLGIHGSLLGFLLVMPNVLSLVVFIMAHVLMQIQVRLEEEHLKKNHGQAYAHYSENVRRWI